MISASKCRPLNSVGRLRRIHRNVPDPRLSGLQHFPNLYVAVQQQGIRTLNRAMPALGAATILVTIVAAVLGRADGARLGLLIAAIICFVAAGLITRFLNQPINTIVMTWSTNSTPVNWMGLRDQWWRWHLAPLAAGLGGLSLVIASTLQPSLALAS